MTPSVLQAVENCLIDLSDFLSRRHVEDSVAESGAREKDAAEHNFHSAPEYEGQPEVPNFFFDQQDSMRDAGEKHGFTFTVQSGRSPQGEYFPCSL